MMRRTTIKIEIVTEGAVTWLPWTGNAPDFTGFQGRTLSVLQEAWEAGKNNIEVIPDLAPEPVAITPDWDGLSARVLGGDLHPMFNRLTDAADLSVSINRARNDINLAVAYVRVEAALASGLADLQKLGTNYVFTSGEKLLWNNAVTELGFSSLVYI